MPKFISKRDEAMFKNKKAIIFFAVFIVLFRFFYKQNSELTTSTYDVNDPQIPKSFTNYKIISISDLHNKSFGKHNIKLLNKIKRLAPNIIVVTGDLINAYHPDKTIALDFIKEASKIAPIYFINGNHEARMKNYEVFETELRNSNAVILNNQTIEINYKSDYINLLGLADPAWYYTENTNLVLASQLDYLLNPINPVNFTILLSHRPEFMPIYADRLINLVLSGHAHGGQFRVPFLGGLFAPNQGYFPKYSAGKYTESETTMIVSRGLGPSSFPTRLNNKPDLVQVILHPEQN